MITLGLLDVLPIEDPKGSVYIYIYIHSICIYIYIYVIRYCIYIYMYISI